jgi:hypothetical protein
MITKLIINFKKIELKYILPLGLEQIPTLAGPDDYALTDMPSSMHSQPTGQYISRVQTADLVPYLVNKIIYDKLTTKNRFKNQLQRKVHI